MRALGLVVVALAVLLLVPSAAGKGALDGPTPSCTGGCSGWHNANVEVTWSKPAGTSWGSCEFTTVTGETAGQTVSCTVLYADGSTVSASVLIKIDRTPPSVSGGSLARGPDANGWYRSPVGYSFTGSDATSGIASCTSGTYGGPDTGGTSISGTCTDGAGNTSGAASLSLKYDASPPSVEVAASRGPDGNGWYTHAVTFSGSGSDGASGLAGCSSTTYAGPDTADASVSVTCSDNAGNSAGKSATVWYDGTPPAVTGAALDRAPDAGEWYTKPVTATFTGADGGSGLDACPSVTYAGPDVESATVSGTCRDKAGNVSSPRTLSFRFDATPPSLKALVAKKGDRRVSLSWQASADTVALEVLRTPGPAEPVFRGKAASFVDRAVVNGKRYRYLVRATDRAGNAAQLATDVMPRPTLYAPQAGAKLRRPTTLAWEKVKGASYYNVQLYRNGKKVLTLWPKRPWLALKRTWLYQGTRQRLLPGRYDWFVWPGKGKLAQHKYGKRLGRSYFVVVR